MPQFDPANFIPQLVWLTVFFSILYFGIVRLTVPKVGKVMAEREQTVSGDIRTAEAAKAEADRIEAEYQSGVAAARDQARDSLNAARAQAAKAVEARLAAANAEVERKAAEAQAQLNAARERALSEVQAVAAEVAADIVERLTGRRPEPEAATRAVATTALAAE